MRNFAALQAARTGTAQPRRETLINYMETLTKQDIYDFLEKRSVSYDATEHEAAYNMEEIATLPLSHVDAVAKNLFVCDDKKRNYYLITVMGNKKVNLNALRHAYGLRRLSLTTAVELADILGLTPGSVSPFGLLNDTERRVHFLIDASFFNPPSIIGVHPNDNTATVMLNTEDLVRLVREHGNTVTVINL